MIGRHLGILNACRPEKLPSPPLADPRQPCERYDASTCLTECALGLDNSLCEPCARAVGRGMGGEEEVLVLRWPAAFKEKT